MDLRHSPDNYDGYSSDDYSSDNAIHAGPKNPFLPENYVLNPTPLNDQPFSSEESKTQTPKEDSYKVTKEKIQTLLKENKINESFQELENYSSHYQISNQIKANLLALKLETTNSNPYDTVQVNDKTYNSKYIACNTYTQIELMTKHILPAIQDFKLRYYTAQEFMESNIEIYRSKKSSKVSDKEVQSFLQLECKHSDSLQEFKVQKQRTEPFFDKTCAQINDVFNLLERKEIQVSQGKQLTYTTRFDILKQVAVNALDQYIQQQSWWWWLIFIFTGRRKCHIQRAKSLRKACREVKEEEGLKALFETQLCLFKRTDELSKKSYHKALVAKMRYAGDEKSLLKHEREVINKKPEQDNFCQTIASAYHLIKGPKLLIAQDCAIHELSQYSKRWWIWNRGPAQQMIERSQWATNIDELREIIPCP